MSRFLPHNLYSSIFDPPDDRFDDLAKNLWKSVPNDFVANKREHEPIRVLSLGFGAGRLDLPLITALGEAFDGHDIDVTALEPLWSDPRPGYAKAAAARLEDAGFLRSSKTTWKAGGRITVQFQSSEAETWLQKSAGRRFDVVLGLFVLHLLDDWKSVVAMLLDRLSAGAVLVFGENFGTVCCLEGALAHHDHEDPWVACWRRIHDIRRQLLLPAERLVSPQSLSFLYDCLVAAGISRGDSCSIDFEQHLSGEDMRNVLGSVEQGADAATFGRLRILDRAAAVEFAARAAECVTSEYFAFTVGVRLTPFFAGASSRAGAGDKFLAQVGNQAMMQADRVAAVRSAVKSQASSPMAIRNPDQMRKRGLYLLLENAREQLALAGQFPFVVISRKGTRYGTAFTRLPTKLLPSTAQQQAARFLTSYSLYTIEDPQSHLSSLLESLAQTDRIGDLYVHLKLSSRVDDGSAASVHWETTTAGDLLLLELTIPSSITASFWEQVEPLIADLSIAPEILSQAWEGWDTSTNTFLHPWTTLRSGKRMKSALTTPQRGALDAIMRIATSLCAPFKRMMNDTLQDIVPALDPSIQKIFTQVAERCVRVALAVPNAKNTEPVHMFFCASASAYPSRMPVANALLLMLTESDAIAYGLRRGAELRSPTKMIGAVQPLLALLHDLETTYYALQEGELHVWETVGRCTQHIDPDAFERIDTTLDHARILVEQFHRASHGHLIADCMRSQDIVSWFKLELTAPREAAALLRGDSALKMMNTSSFVKLYNRALQITAAHRYAGLTRTDELAKHEQEFIERSLVNQDGLQAFAIETNEAVLMAIMRMLIANALKHGKFQPLGFMACKGRAELVIRLSNPTTKPLAEERGLGFVRSYLKAIHGEILDRGIDRAGHYFVLLSLPLRIIGEADGN